MAVTPQPFRLREPGLVDYADAYAQMRDFTLGRDADTPDEIWFLEHPPVFTLGTNADERHVLAAGDIPVVPVDRGGQVTYHGPGQLVVYLLLDLQRLHLGIRDMVCRLEQAIIATLAGYDIESAGREGAPGVYVDNEKIASIGLRIRRHCSYHGIAINVDPDLTHFSRINPCGYAGLQVTSIARLGGTDSVATVAGDLLPHLCDQLGLRLPD